MKYVKLIREFMDSSLNFSVTQLIESIIDDFEFSPSEYRYIIRDRNNMCAVGWTGFVPGYYVHFDTAVIFLGPGDDGGRSENSYYGPGLEYSGIYEYIIEIVDTLKSQNIKVVHIRYGVIPNPNVNAPSDDLFIRHGIRGATHLVEPENLETRSGKKISRLKYIEILFKGIQNS